MTGAGKSLAWLELDEEEGREYWQAMTLAGDYAAANHHIIHHRMEAALGLQAAWRVENHHNFAWQEPQEQGPPLVIHRKGATPATPGTLGIIPGSMTAPAFIVRGKGNEASLHSAAHGAGRRFSRNQAKKHFTPAALEKHLKKYGVSLIGGATDEAPMAYKNIEQVMQAQADLVDPIARFYPQIVRMA